jgi:hypothetical protein
MTLPAHLDGKRKPGETIVSPARDPHNLKKTSGLL